MPIITNIANLSQTAANNGPDGAVDPPSTLDDQIRYLGAFIAQLRDQVGYTLPIFAPGMMSMYGGGTAPNGWLICNGVAVSRTTYAALFAAISTNWGSGDGSTTFNLPDMRGVVPRGVDGGRGLDTGRVLGSYQDTSYQSHTHGVNDAGHGHGVNDPTHNHGVADSGHSHTAWTDVQGDHAHTFERTHRSPYASMSGGAGILYDSYENWGTSVSGAHGHNIGVSTQGTGIGIYGNGTGISIQGGGTGISIQASGIGETRMRNNACNFIIHV